MRFSKGLTAVWVLIPVACAVLLSMSPTGPRLVFAQTATSQSPPAAEVPLDPYDRVSQVWYSQRLGASGWQRGQEIYYMRCWICHNEYTVTAEPGAAPTLRDLYKRPALRTTGEPVNDTTVTAVIRKGNFKMPAYSPTNFIDKDLADLLVYLKEKCGTFATGGGCFDEHNPPANPRYRVQ